MKHNNLLSGGLSLLIALILLGCGILVPSALLEFQEQQILRSKSIYPIEAQELESSGQNLSSSKEYQALYYRLVVWEIAIKYQEHNKILSVPKEYELSQENAVEKSKQELSRLSELGACPRIDLDSFSLSEATLMGTEVNSDSFILEEIIANGLVDLGQVDLSQRVSRWRIVWQHKTNTEDCITIAMDAQTGKIYSCEIMQSASFDFAFGEFLLMFGKYHDLLEFRNGWDSDYLADSILYFNNIQIMGNLQDFDESYSSKSPWPKSHFYMTIQARWYW